MKKQIYIEYNSDYTDRCDSCCPFFDYDHCKLFDVSLREVELDEGYEWNNCEPPRLRCDDCLTM